ncbi:unnamed protein product [Rotaria sp. Silwood1]|nr:unnamed protein product [Rotaria sp. Silwood1]CAF4895169.1 unnamed protein product [Rotaria sp. Silwood1]
MAIYNQNSCFYGLLYKALRQENIDLLFYSRFFIYDIKQELEQNKCSSSKRVYRGQRISLEKINMLKNLRGQFISFKLFLSPSLDLHASRSFLSNSDNSELVIFHIDANPKLNHIKPFSDITLKSSYSDEEEVLFILGSIFQLINIYHHQDGIWMIQIKLCSYNDRQLKSLFQYIKNEYDDEEKTLLSFGHILEDMGKYDDAEKYYRRLLNELTYDHIDLAACYLSLGNVVHESNLE